MKKNFLKLIAIFATLALILSATPMLGVSAETEEGLVARYTFDDAENLGKDSTGNNNLIVGGSGELTSVKGKVGNGAWFDGNSYLATESLDDFSDDLVDYTITFWGQRETGAAGELIAMGAGWRGNSPGNQIFLNDGYLCSGVYTSAGTETWNWYQTAVTGLSHFAVAVSNNATTLKMYKDGVKVYENNLTDNTFTMDNPNYYFAIGGTLDLNGFHAYGFKGLLDEVSIYNYGFTDAQVKAQYDSYMVVSENSLVSHYSFEDSSNLGKDELGNNNLIAVGDNIGSADGKVGKGVSFGGDTVLHTASNTDFTDEFIDYTVSFWAKADEVEGESIAIGSGWRDTGNGMHINLQGDYFCTGLRKSEGGGSWNHFPTDINVMKFYTVTVSNGGTKLTMYVDGVAVEAYYDTTTGTFLMNNPDNPFAIGGLTNGTGWIGYSFNGVIDEVSVYNYALSAAEVKASYDAYAAVKVNELIAYYSFDDANNLGKDTSGKGNNLTTVGAPAAVAGKYGNAVSFDGASMLRTASTADFTDELTDFTMSFWAQRDSSDTTSEMMPISTAWRDGDLGGMQVNFNPADYFCVGIGKTNNVIGAWYYPNTDFYQLQYYTITVSNNAKTATVYINGQQVQTETLTDDTFNMNDPTYRGLTIGAIYEGNYYFKGIIDDVAIYNYGLTADEVSELYHTYVPREKHLVAHYSFDDASDFGKDSVGENHLTLMGENASAVDGKIGSALKLGGETLLKSFSGEDFTDSLVDYTMTFWGQRDASVGGEMMVLSSGWRDSTAGAQIHLNDGYLCAGLRDSNNNASWNWYQTNVTGMSHYAVTVSDNGTKVTMYKDGVEVYTNTLASGKFLMNNPAYPFAIGGFLNDVNFIGWTFYGVIDEVSVYDYGMTAAEVNELLDSYDYENQGDINGDGAVNILDLVSMKKNIAGVEGDYHIVFADANRNGKVDADDMIGMSKFLLGALPGFFGYAQVTDPFNVAPAFNNDMVLQRNEPVRVFGFGGEVGETVTVSYQNQTKQTAIVGSEWEVYLDAMPATNVGSDMVITCGDKTETYTNVVVGEVWYCSGQSNMAIDLAYCSNKDNSILADYAQYNNFDNIRTVVIPYNAQPRDDINVTAKLGWKTHTGTDSAMGVSATALSYALNLQAMLGNDIPVAVIACSVGGSDIRTWFDNATNNACDYPLDYKYYGTAFYNGMTAYTAGYTIGGMLWYQGEANASPNGEAAYKSLFGDLVTMYRRVFNNPELPIITCQLVQFDTAENWGYQAFRQAQWELMDEIDGVYTVCGADCGDNSDMLTTGTDAEIAADGDWRIHPADKWPIGQRAAGIAVKEILGLSYDDLAVKTAYGVSPDITAATKTDAGIVLSVANAATLTQSEGALNYFEVYNGSAWTNATATISGNTVILAADTDVTAVRYLYDDKFDEGTAFIYNEYGLPLAPIKSIAVN